MAAVKTKAVVIKGTVGGVVTEIRWTWVIDSTRRGVGSNEDHPQFKLAHFKIWWRHMQPANNQPRAQHS